MRLRVVGLRRQVCNLTKAIDRVRCSTLGDVDVAKKYSNPRIEPDALTMSDDVTTN